MDFKEYLISVGLTEEQAAKVVEGMPANKFHLAAEENLDIRYSKLKEQKEQVEADLTNANKLVNDLKKNYKDVEDLQKQITDYEGKVTELEKERAQERKTYALKERLAKEGVQDIDYMLYKLGDVEVDKDGNIVDLDNKVKALKEANPTFFQASEPQTKSPAGYQVIDNGLPQGKLPAKQPESLKEALADRFSQQTQN